MRVCLRVLLLLDALLFGGCSAEYRIHLRSEVLELTYVTRNVDLIEWKLGPERPEHQRLSKWIEQNQGGWSSYIGTTIAGGLYVDTSDWRVQFLNNTVFVCPRKKGCWMKTVTLEEYEYLLQTRPK